MRALMKNTYTFRQRPSLAKMPILYFLDVDKDIGKLSYANDIAPLANMVILNVQVMLDEKGSWKLLYWIQTDSFFIL